MDNPKPSLACAVGAFLLLASSALGEWICWSDHRDARIQCALPDGSELTDLFSGLGKPRGMAVDRVNETLYWTDGDFEQVIALDLVDYADPNPIVQLAPLSGVRGVAAAPSIGKIYWVAEDLVPGMIQRANFDGSGVESLPVPPGAFFDVAVDETNNTLFWVDGPRIWRGNLDGTGAVAIVTDANEPYYVAVDGSAGKLYWTNFGNNSIDRANLDGSGREVPFSGLTDQPIGIAVDAPSGKLYWTLNSGQIQRANLDGTGLETIVATGAGTWDIVILPRIPITGPVPATSSWGLLVLALTMLSATTIVLRHRTVKYGG